MNIPKTSIAILLPFVFQLVALATVESQSPSPSPQPSSSTGLSTVSSPEGIIPGRLIVTFDASVACSISQMFGNQLDFSSLGSSGDQLKSILQNYSVYKIQPVYRTDDSGSTATCNPQLQSNFANDVLAEVQKRFPIRAARAVVNSGVATQQLFHTYQLYFPDDVSTDDLRTDLMTIPIVKSAWANMLIAADSLSSGTPTDSEFANQEHLSQIQAPEAWQTGTYGNGVVVAIVDSGIDLNHSDLKQQLWTNTAEIPGNGIDDDHNGKVDDTNGWNFDSKSSNIQDSHGHGTHLAGIIGAAADNGGVVGVAPGVKIMPIRVFGTTGSTDMVTAAQGILYACTMGADIINLSFGGPRKDSETFFELIIASVKEMGCLVTKAAGNERRSTYSTELRNDAGVLIVGASQGTLTSETLAGFSNYGSLLDVMAPGVAILSSKLGGGSVRISGTSMATAIASGVAALILSKYPNLKLTQLVQTIKANADILKTRSPLDLDPSQTKTVGRINALRSISNPVLSTVRFSNEEVYKNLVNKKFTFPLFVSTDASGYTGEVLLSSENNPLTWSRVCSPFPVPQSNQTEVATSCSSSFVPYPSGRYYLKVRITAASGKRFEEIIGLGLDDTTGGLSKLIPLPSRINNLVAQSSNAVVSILDDKSLASLHIYDIPKKVKLVTVGSSDYSFASPFLYNGMMLSERRDPKTKRSAIALTTISSGTTEIIPFANADQYSFSKPAFLGSNYIVATRSDTSVRLFNRKNSRDIAIEESGIGNLKVSFFGSDGTGLVVARKDANSSQELGLISIDASTLALSYVKFPTLTDGPGNLRTPGYNISDLQRSGQNILFSLRQNVLLGSGRFSFLQKMRTLPLVLFGSAPGYDNRSSLLAESASCDNFRYSSPLISYQDNRDGDSDIFLYDESSAREYQVSFSSREQSRPALADSTVLWLEMETGGSTVTIQNLSGVLPQPTPSPAPGIS